MKHRHATAALPCPARRNLLLAAMSAALAPACTTSPHVVSPEIDEDLAALEQHSGGRLGVHALDVNTGESFGLREDEPFAMCSTFKLLLAAAVLHRHERESRSWLDHALPVKRADLVDHSPVTAQHLSRGVISVREACQATVTVSDNAAANLLLPLVGGPAGLTAFLRNTCDDPASRLDRMEPALNSNLDGDLRDTTTPRAMARTTARLLAGHVLAASSREQLAAWLTASTTGLSRVRGGLPTDWRTGDKTGTGMNGAVNDVAVAWPAGRLPIVIAVYTSGSARTLPELEQIHARVGALVVSRWG